MKKAAGILIAAGTGIALGETMVDGRKFISVGEHRLVGVRAVVLVAVVAEQAAPEGDDDLRVVRLRQRQGPIEKG